MKIIHTSDWHLGNSLYNYDRTKEQASMLDQITWLVKEECPDALLICGDIYDVSQPSIATQTLFTEAMMNMHKARPQMTIVCTAGNHDSPARHEIFREPWLGLGVHCIGCLHREQPVQHIIRIPGKGTVIALPYVHERNMPEGFIQQLTDMALEGDSQHLPVILTAHTTMEQCDLHGHDGIGGIEGTSISQMGKGYDYLALGHIHHAQWLRGGNKRIRYCGSPLPVSFDEDYEHTVSIITIDRHGDPAQLRTVPIRNPHPLVSLPTSGYASWEEAKRLLKEFPSDIPAYIRLCVDSHELLPDNASSEAAAIAEGKECRFCLVNQKKRVTDTDDGQTISIEEFRQEPPLNIARMYASQQGLTLDDEMEDLFNQTVKELEEEEE